MQIFSMNKFYKIVLPSFDTGFDIEQFNKFIVPVLNRADIDTVKLSKEFYINKIYVSFQVPVSTVVLSIYVF